MGRVLHHDLDSRVTGIRLTADARRTLSELTLVAEQRQSMIAFRQVQPDHLDVRARTASPDRPFMAR